MLSDLGLGRSKVQQQLKESMLKKINMSALGNSNRTLKDLTVDVIHASGLGYKEIAQKAYLHPTTVEKLAEEITKFPRIDTCERILKCFLFDIQATAMKAIDTKYLPTPKTKKG